MLLCSFEMSDERKSESERDAMLCNDEKRSEEVDLSFHNTMVEFTMLELPRSYDRPSLILDSRAALRY